MKKLLASALAVSAIAGLAWVTLAAQNPVKGAGGNLPPECCFGPECLPPATTVVIPCTGDETTFVLDGSQSHDPEGNPLSFQWFSCPGSTIDDPFAPITLLRIDTSASCDKFCGIRLFLSDGKLETHCRLFIQVVPAPEGGDMDIKPGSCPNPINVGANGVVPVALTGTTSFDVNDVDPSTLELVRTDGVGGSVSPTSHKIEDVATPFLDELCDCHTLTSDGVRDLSLKFDKQELVTTLQLASEPDMSFLELTLKGKLFDGTEFEVSDCIRVQGT